MTAALACACTHEDPGYHITTYQSRNADLGKEWCARVQHPRTKLHIFFEGPTEAGVIEKATAFWNEHRAEREEMWARLDAAKAARAAKKEAA